MGSDTINAPSSDQNIIFGLGGNDTLNGANQGDCILGGPCNDTITGNNSSPIPDVLIGGDGDDTISGEIGIDFLFGDDGDDTLDGGSGMNDTCVGGSGSDTITNCELP